MKQDEYTRTCNTHHFNIKLGVLHSTILFLCGTFLLVRGDAHTNTSCTITANLVHIWQGIVFLIYYFINFFSSLYRIDFHGRISVYSQ